MQPLLTRAYSPQEPGELLGLWHLHHDLDFFAILSHYVFGVPVYRYVKEGNFLTLLSQFGSQHIAVEEARDSLHVVTFQGTVLRERPLTVQIDCITQMERTGPALRVIL